MCHVYYLPNTNMERVKGFEPSPSAWKAEVLPLNYTRINLVEGGGFEPPKAEPSDLQSDPFGHSGTPPAASGAFCSISQQLSIVNLTF